MELLKDFAQRDMIEQIMVLEEIKENRQVAAINGLIELCAHPLEDQAVNEMIYHALFDLLADDEAAMIAGLNHESIQVRQVCLRRMQESRPAAALPVLIALLKAGGEPEYLGEIIKVLGSYADPGANDLLFSYMRHQDEALATWAMQVLADNKAPGVRDELIRLITERQGMILASGECDMMTGLALEDLSRFTDDVVIDFFISHIHHQVPNFRRIVLAVLTGMGKVILPALQYRLISGTRDERIMAANIIGLLGEKRGVDILIDQLDQNSDIEPNLKFAIYEALGRINSLKSAIGLTDGLKEQDELVIMAVVTGLDNLCNPGIVKFLVELLDKNDNRSVLIRKALVTARASNLFAALYDEGRHSEALMATLLASGDQEARALFRELLAGMAGDRAASDSRRLAAEQVVSGAVVRRVLAADDSKAMLFFYKGVFAELGMELSVANDGREALDALLDGSALDLLVTDMNMPNMDGIELARTIRKQGKWQNLPILMATTESEKSQSDLAAKAGVTDFITKPFSKEQFKGKIQQMLG
ncbi:MAG: hypothetical protein A2511_00555 [Deltaproteobacteria bacterium RIFOXYD12_FULL_50_9]|nr:MAG: hypothetical protein A2511_00555 [Deltaproteobacteria bacterium RIFOXYD12_FULL_50_9]